MRTVGNAPRTLPRRKRETHETGSQKRFPVLVFGPRIPEARDRKGLIETLPHSQIPLAAYSHPIRVNPGIGLLRAFEGFGNVRASDSNVEAYRCGGGAAWYVAKMFPREDTSFDVGGLEHFARSPEAQPALVH